MHVMDVAMIQDNQDLINRLESFLSNPLQPFDYSLLQQAYNEIMALRKAKDTLYTTINLVGDLNIKYEADAQRWRQATYHLAHMLSRLDGGADADKFAVEAYEATSTCYCEIENQVYCHIHW